MREFARQLEVADPGAASSESSRSPDRAGPPAARGASPRKSYCHNGSSDLLGFGWTFQAHLDAWRRLRRRWRRYPLIRHASEPSISRIRRRATTRCSGSRQPIRCLSPMRSSPRITREGGHPPDERRSLRADQHASVHAGRRKPEQMQLDCRQLRRPHEHARDDVAAWPDHEWQIQTPSGAPTTFRGSSSRAARCSPTRRRRRRRCSSTPRSSRSTIHKRLPTIARSSTGRARAIGSRTSTRC